MLRKRLIKSWNYNNEKIKSFPSADADVILELLKPVLFLSHFCPPYSYDDVGNVNVAPNVQRGMHCMYKQAQIRDSTGLSGGLNYFLDVISSGTCISVGEN